MGQVFVQSVVAMSGQDAVIHADGTEGPTASKSGAEVHVSKSVESSAAVNLDAGQRGSIYVGVLNARSTVRISAQGTGGGPKGMYGALVRIADGGTAAKLEAVVEAAR